MDPLDELETGIEQESQDVLDTPDDLGDALLEDQERVDAEEAETEGEPEEEAAVEEPAEEPIPISTQEWARILAESPQRWTEVPKRELPNVIQAIRENDAATYRRQVAQEREAAARNAEYMAKVEREVEQLDQLRNQSPEQFAEWEKGNPKAAASYYRFKADRYQQQQAPPQVPPEQQAEIAYREAADKLLARVHSNPDVMAELNKRASADQSRYAATAEGFANLSADIAELQNRPSPRKAAAEQRKAVPKPDRTPAARGGGRLRAKDLDAMTVEQIAALDEEELAAAISNA